LALADHLRRSQAYRRRFEMMYASATELVGLAFIGGVAFIAALTAAVALVLWLAAPREPAAR
jgi:hypothetical protein